MSAYCQDPAAGAGAADRRAGVRVLPVQPAADAVQPDARAKAIAAERARRRVPAARGASSRAAFERRGAPPPARCAAPPTTTAGGAATRSTPPTPRSTAIRGQAARWCATSPATRRYRGRTGDTPTPDVNYVFPTFVTTRLPIGLVGLIIAAIFAAAMSSIAAELNSLATVHGHRHLPAATSKPAETDAHYLRVSRLATGFWGLFACVVATFAAGLGSLIEVVNRFGSFFYGSLLGVFVLALAFRRSERPRRLLRPGRRDDGGGASSRRTRRPRTSRFSGTTRSGSSSCSSSACW